MFRFVVTDDKEGPGSEFQKHLPDVRQYAYRLTFARLSEQADSSIRPRF